MKRMKKSLWPIALLFIAAFLSSCGKTPQNEATPAAAQKIIKAQLEKLSETGHGALWIAGQGEDKIHVLKVWGSSFDMGVAYGELLKTEITDYVATVIGAMVQESGQPVSALDEVFAATKPFIPAHFMDELRGLSKGSGVPLQDLIRANFIGEAGEWHCSLFGAWGDATADDGHLYQLRALDYEVHANIQKYPLIVVYFPQDGHPFANITWSGVVGCISGISSERLAISEIGDDYDQGNDTFAGMPFMFLLRDVLQFDNSLDEAIARIKSTPRTTSLLYGIGDGELGELRGFQTSHTLCNVFDANNLEPVTKTHQRIKDIVYWGMSWDVPAYDGPLHDKLVEHYGHINAEATITDILPSVGTGNLQAVVYDLTAMKIWVANARADDESGPLQAYHRQFVEFDMNEMFQK